MIIIENINKSFGNQVIFNNFSLTIDDGEFVIISGASGKGKTTLLNIIGFLEPFDSGNVVVDGISIKDKKNQREYWAKKVGFLFQNFALIENKTVAQNLEIVKKSMRTGFTIDEALSKVGLISKKNNKVFTLSGGEQQRVALARLFLKKCDIVLADEPTGSLDRKNAETVLRLLSDLNSEGKTVLIVTHDEKIKGIGKRVIEL